MHEITNMASRIIKLPQSNTTATSTNTITSNTSTVNCCAIALYNYNLQQSNILYCI